jgi:hypothetical protein
MFKKKHAYKIWWLTSIIPATWKVKIRRITVRGQPRQKVSETPISTNKLCMVVHTCDPSYLGGHSLEGHSLNIVLGNLKKHSKKGWGCSLSRKAPD